MKKKLLLYLIILVLTTIGSAVSANDIKNDIAKKESIKTVDKENSSTNWSGSINYIDKENSSTSWLVWGLIFFLLGGAVVAVVTIVAFGKMKDNKKILLDVSKNDKTKNELLKKINDIKKINENLISEKEESLKEIKRLNEQNNKIEKLLLEICKKMSDEDLYKDLESESISAKVKEILMQYRIWKAKSAVSIYLGGSQTVLYDKLVECLKENDSKGLKETVKLYIEEMEKDFKNYKI